MEGFVDFRYDHLRMFDSRGITPEKPRKFTTFSFYSKSFPLIFTNSTDIATNEPIRKFHQSLYSTIVLFSISKSLNISKKPFKMVPEFSRVVSTLEERVLI